MVKTIFLIFIFLITVCSGASAETKKKQNENDHQSRSSESKVKIVYLDMLNELHEMSKSIDIYSDQATAATDGSFRNLKKIRNSSLFLLPKLQSGDLSTGLPAFIDNPKVRMEDVTRLWEDVGANIDTILLAEGTIKMLREYFDALNETIPVLLREFYNIIRNYPDTTVAGVNQKNNIINQLPQNFRTKENFKKIFANTRLTEFDIETLNNDVSQIGKVLVAMINGNSRMNIEKVRDSKVQHKLAQVNELFATIAELVNRIKKETQTLSGVKIAVNNISSIDGQFEDSITAVIENYKKQ